MAVLAKSWGGGSRLPGLGASRRPPPRPRPLATSLAPPPDLGPCPLLPPDHLPLAPGGPASSRATPLSLLLPLPPVASSEHTPSAQARRARVKTVASRFCLGWAAAPCRSTLVLVGAPPAARGGPTGACACPLRLGQPCVSLRSEGPPTRSGRSVGLGGQGRGPPRPAVAAGSLRGRPRRRRPSSGRRCAAWGCWDTRLYGYGNREGWCAVPRRVGARRGKVMARQGAWFSRLRLLGCPGAAPGIGDPSPGRRGPQPWAEPT